MARRRGLSAEDKALWSRVAATAEWLVERFGEEAASFAGVAARS